MQTEKLYEQDAYCRAFTARVLSCEMRRGAESPEGLCYAVILDKTAFFPEGGGQSADTGILEQREPADDPMLAEAGVYKCVTGASVLDVQEENGEIVHFTSAPLTVGSEVTGELEWEKRLRKMQNHTGEHLVSGLVHSHFGYDNVGFHLGTDGVTVDFSGPLTQDDLVRIEQEANRAVAENVAVTVSYPKPEEFASMDCRSKIELQGDIRIVTIDGYDVCACCAPHVSRTGAIGAVKILSCEKWKEGVRLHMLCGLDAMDDYTARQTETGRISVLLSCPQLGCAEAVERLMKAQAAEREETAKLRRALLESRISALQQTAGNLVLFEDLLDANGLRNLVNAGVPLAGGVCAAFTGSDAEGWRYIVGSASVQLRGWVREFNAALNGRGGGSDEMVQGTVKATAEEIRAFLA